MGRLQGISLTGERVNKLPASEKLMAGVVCEVSDTPDGSTNRREETKDPVGADNAYDRKAER